MSRCNFNVIAFYNQVEKKALRKQKAKKHLLQRYKSYKPKWWERKIKKSYGINIVLASHFWTNQ